MKHSHAILLLLGLLAQGAGWTVSPRRLKGLLAGLALGLDGAWLLWYFTDARSLSVSGFWALSPVATWVCVHVVLVPLIVLECLAWALPWWRWWVRGVGLVLVLAGYGWGLGEAYGPPVVTQVALAFPDLPPAFEGYRLVLVSDLHAGPYAGTRTLGRWARAVEALHGDLLVGAGDFIAYLPEEAERTGVAFAGITAPDGRLGVLGNHDQRPGDDEVAERLRRHGWVMLEDEPFVLRRGAQSLLILGARYKDEAADPSPVPWRGRPWPGGFRIGVCHSPGQWPRMLLEGARLTLCGHTHGGQVDLSPFYNPAEERSPFVYGLYAQGPDRLCVTRGLGVSALPFRFRCRPEIMVLTLHRS
jgi:hypothetical protein